MFSLFEISDIVSSGLNIKVSWGIYALSNSFDVIQIFDIVAAVFRILSNGMIIPQTLDFQPLPTYYN